MYIKTLLDRVVHGLADVQHGVEDDRVSGELHLVSAGDKPTHLMRRLIYGKVEQSK